MSKTYDMSKTNESKRPIKNKLCQNNNTYFFLMLKATNGDKTTLITKTAIAYVLDPKNYNYLIKVLEDKDNPFKEFIENAIKTKQGYGIYCLAKMYDLGKGIPKNQAMALKLYEESVKAGISISLHDVASIHYQNKNYKMAFDIFNQSIKAGNITSLNGMGAMYHNGDYVKEDKKHAFKLIEKCANSGDNKAIHNLGLAYLNGYGVNVDTEKAIKLFEKGINMRYPCAIDTLANLYLHGWYVIKNVQKAYDLYIINAVNGDAKAIDQVYNILSNKFNRKLLTNKSIMVGVGALQKSVDLDEKFENVFRLGCMFRDGIGCNKSSLKAKHLFKRALRIADKGSESQETTKAIMELGKLYMAVGKRQKALALYETYSGFGNVSAMQELRSVYTNDALVAHDWTFLLHHKTVLTKKPVELDVSEERRVVIRQLEGGRRIVIVIILGSWLRDSICDIVASYVNVL